MKPTPTMIIVAAAVFTACGSHDLGPQQGSLRLDASIGRSTIGIGDTTSIVFRLRNLSTHSIVLSFNDSCQVLPYITTQSAEVVHPSGGAWGCYLVLTNLTLGPGAESVTSVRVQGGDQATHPGISLLPGEYRTYARLEHPDFPLRSPTITFRVD